jgi:7SK snRNA methylphosphate capping enzyme
VKGSPLQLALRDYILLHVFDIDLAAFDYHAATVTGVDIDPNLVKQANKLLALRASRARPPTKESQLAVDYFPISAVLTHGYRIEPERQFARSSTSAAAPSLCPRVRFFSADWVTTSNQDPAGPYDIILALSGR